MLHRTVGFVFKLIGVTIVALIIFDTATMLSDAFITNNRIQAQANLMQQEIAKNNYMSKEAHDMFKGKLLPSGESTGFQRISDLSKVYGAIRFNYQNDLNAFRGGLDSSVYDIDSVDKIKDYGEFQTLVIAARFNPWQFYYSLGNVFTREESHNYITYTYTIPCLRYLK